MSNKLPTESKIFTNLKRSVDDRGQIMSIVDTSVQNVSIIHCYENTIRSNHYHKIDFHFMYVLEGEIDYFYKSLNDNIVKYLKVLKGETIFTPNLEIHATYFPIDTRLVVSSGFPRDQKTYEEDTVRVSFINNENVHGYLEKYEKS